MPTPAASPKFQTPYRGHQATPPSAEKGGARRLSDLFPLQVVAPSQFSRDFRPLSFCALEVTESRGAKEKGGEGRGTARPPSCLYPRFARARLSVTHASPPLRGAQASELPLFRRSAGAALALPGSPEQRCVSVRDPCGREGEGARRRRRRGEGRRFPPQAETSLPSRGRRWSSVRPAAAMLCFLPPGSLLLPPPRS